MDLIGKFRVVYGTGDDVSYEVVDTEERAREKASRAIWLGDTSQVAVQRRQVNDWVLIEAHKLDA